MQRTCWKCSDVEQSYLIRPDAALLPPMNYSWVIFTSIAPILLHGIQIVADFLDYLLSLFRLKSLTLCQKK